MDIVAYSKMKMDQQSQRITQLGEIVRSTAEYQRAQSADQIVSLPTGDGMALVFFQNPVAPVECATQISRALKSYPEIKLRMGVHTGTVYRINDINTNRNVAGEGINLAQRVMDCGDSGHILLSKTVSDILNQLSDNWEPHLHDLGEAEVKHGVKVNVVNFCTGEVGNPALPEKLRKSATLPPQPPAAAMMPVAAASTLPAAAQVERPVPHPTPQPTPQATPHPMVQYAPAAASPGGARRSLLLVAAAVVLVVVGAAAARFGPWRAATPSATEAQPAQSSMAPVGGAMPPAGGSPPGQASPPPPSSAAPGGAPAAGTSVAASKATESAPGKTALAGSSPAVPRATQAQTRSDQPEPAAPAEAVSSPQPAEGSADRERSQETRERMIRLAARAATAARSIRSMEQAQASRGFGLRADMSAARDQMEFLMEDAQRAAQERDFETAGRNMDLAERQIEKIENFLGR
jgi:hypothetical protein